MMDNFIFRNPTRIIFGKGSISKLSKYVPKKAKVLVLFGGGSIKSNGVYDQVMQALKKHEVVEFGGIEANPDYDTLMKAVEIVKEEKIDFLLAVGGGSVIDGTKFISLAAANKLKDPWKLLTNIDELKLKKAIPLGTVLTLPATGTEMNPNSVISRRATQEKLAFAHPKVFPKFSILDPETTYTLPKDQVRNGIVDAYVHVMEQYLTYPVGAIVQDRQAEAILLALVEAAPKALQDPPNYEGRASYMWAATNALNKLICQGVPQDWTTHNIGHELTAFYGLAHAETLAVVLPYVLWYKREQKSEKLVQYGKRIWNGTANGKRARMSEAIEKTAAFFQSVGMPTTLTAYGIDPEEAALKVSQRFTERGTVMGENNDIKPEDVANILRLSR
jgi:NADP-dependent alcohol dehydrogenase